jgi:hypothetical protein
MKISCFFSLHMKNIHTVHSNQTLRKVCEMNSHQRNIWMSNTLSLAPHNQSSKTNLSMNDARKVTLKNTGSPMCMCIRCCVIGSLVAGLALAIILALWLTSPAKKVTTSQSMSVIYSYWILNFILLYFSLSNNFDSSMYTNICRFKQHTLHDDTNQ